MAKLLVSQTLKGLWKEYFKESVFSRPGGTLVTATAEQKQALKEAWVAQKGGIFGWNILTLAQAQRRESAIGQWELEAIAKSVWPVSLWPMAAGWAKDVFLWLGAGYELDKIPLEPAWKERTRQVFKKIGGRKLTVQTQVHADIALGFDPLEVYNVHAEEYGLIVESEEVTPSQMTQISAMEARLGGAVWCDIPAKKDFQNICVGAAAELVPAIQEQLLADKNLRRIVWQGELAKSAVLQLQGARPQKHDYPWMQEEAARGYRMLHKRPESFSARLAFARLRAANGAQPWKTQEALEKKAADAWEKEGRLAGFEADVFLLPAEETPECFSQRTKEILGEIPKLKEILKQIERIQEFLPTKITRELWLEFLDTSGQEERFYGGLCAMSLEKAQGLLDDEAIVIWSSLPAEREPALIHPQELRLLNAAEFKENKIPQRGYLETDTQRKIYARKSAAQKLTPWVVLAGGQITKEMTLENRVYSAREPQAHMPELTARHAQRHNPRQKFGRYDNALPLPLRLSSKQWEGALLAPELMWYEAQKLRQLWAGAGKLPAALWVGNWVHAAMKAGATPEKINEFFEKISPAGSPVYPQLPWSEARAQAWQIAHGFARALQNAGAKIIESEWPVAGSLHMDGQDIPINGRIDAVVELPQGQRLIVDFKTSAAATTLTHSKIETGDGLQLWLYGRLYQHEKEVGLCRLAVDKKLEAQLMVEEKILPAEERMAQIAQTGVLGWRGWVWGRFGGENRLPIAALAMDWRIIQARRKETYGRAD